MYQTNAFHKICNIFFNYVASAGWPIAAGNCLLHYMHSGKKKPHNMTPQSFYIRSQKALHAIKLLDCYYEKEVDNDNAKNIFFYSFSKGTSRIMCATVSQILMTKPSKTSRTSTRAITMLTLQKRLIIQTLLK